MLFATGLVQRNKRKESARKAALKNKEKQKKKEQENKEMGKKNVKETTAGDKRNVKAKSPAAAAVNNDAAAHDDLCELKPQNLNLLGKLFAYFTSTIITTFYVSVVFFIAMYAVIKQGYFDSAFTENGLEFYAERPHPTLKKYFPMLDMPLNVIVNLGYLNVGLVIVAHTQKVVMNKKLNTKDAIMFFIFGWSSFLYGHVQFWRIILQRQHESVMDQWITLPLFAWTICWTLHMYYGWSLLTNIAIIALSTASYCLTLYDKFGFEMALGAHIFAAAICGITLYWNFPLPKIRRAFWITASLCLGFVVLKVVDLELPKYHEIFFTISGHFLSKICDFLQIYFAAKFMLHINFTVNKYNLRSVEKPRTD